MLSGRQRKAVPVASSSGDSDDSDELRDFCNKLAKATCSPSASEEDAEASSADTAPEKRLTQETKELLELFSSLRGGPDITRYFNSLPLRERKLLLRAVRRDMGVRQSPTAARSCGKPLFIRIVEFDTVESKLPLGLKVDLLKRYFTPGSSPEKNVQWLETILRIPFGKYAPRISERDLTGSQKLLDSVVYGHPEAKHKLISYMAQLLRNQDSSGLILGLKSYPGVGKTNLVDVGVSRILRRPFYSTSLGGVHDSAFLRGFQYTYEGSEVGYMARCLLHGSIMNPVFFFDELDKVSQTPQGDEIINTLIQITDPTQSKIFQDRYLGSVATLDLSRCIFVFAYNDRSAINPILRDRITEIELHGFSPEDKLIIARDYMIPRIVTDIGFPVDQVPKITDAAISAVIDRYTNEAGVRHLRRILDEIFMELNLHTLMGRASTPSISQMASDATERVWSHIHKMKTSESSSSTSSSTASSVALVEIEHLEQLIRTYKPISIERTSRCRVLGRVNGLFVDGNGCSGILPLEATWVPSAKRASYEMRYTGNLGKVMGESARVAWSVAWNLLDQAKQDEWIRRWHPERTTTTERGILAGRLSGHSTLSGSTHAGDDDLPPVFDTVTPPRRPLVTAEPTGVSRGCLHVHCRDNAMPKDGPSAGVALTILMWSMLTDTPLPQEIAYTGEIGLHGTLLPIGGLQEKLVGAHRAGCTIVVIPQSNVDHLPARVPGTEDSSMRVLPFNTIHEVLSLIRLLI